MPDPRLKGTCTMYIIAMNDGMTKSSPESTAHPTSTLMHGCTSLLCVFATPVCMITTSFHSMTPVYEIYASHRCWSRKAICHVVALCHLKQRTQQTIKHNKQTCQWLTYTVMWCVTMRDIHCVYLYPLATQMLVAFIIPLHPRCWHLKVLFWWAHIMCFRSTWPVQPCWSP